MLTHYSN